MAERRPRRRSTIATLIVLVACSACIAWAARVAWDLEPGHRLTRMLRDPRASERIRAAVELAEEPTMEDPEEAAAMLPVLLERMRDEDPAVRLAILKCVNSVVQSISSPHSRFPPGPPRLRDLNAAVEVLTVALHDKDPLVRAEAADGLAYLDPYSRSEIPDLIAAIHDPDATVREGVVWPLGSAGLFRLMWGIDVPRRRHYSRTGRVARGSRANGATRVTRRTLSVSRRHGDDSPALPQSVEGPR